LGSSSKSSAVINSVSKRIEGKCYRPIRLQNKYIGVQRLDFDDENMTDGIYILSLYHFNLHSFFVIDFL
jgi:hypothetical protein